MTSPPVRRDSYGRVHHKNDATEDFSTLSFGHICSSYLPSAELAVRSMLAAWVKDLLATAHTCCDWSRYAAK
mgnify:FL=1